jgi:hypothetical protein
MREECEDREEWKKASQHEAAKLNRGSRLRKSAFPDGEVNEIPDWQMRRDARRFTETHKSMKSPKTPKPEKQIDTEADNFAQEVNYAVAHGGRELHPEQHDKRSGKKHEQPSTPWQID